MITVAAVVAAAGYAAAWRRNHLRVVGAGRRWQWRHWQAVAFGAGLVLATAACSPPVESLVHRFFWAQIAQRMVLVMTAAPLLAAGAPAMIAIRALPWLPAVIRRAPALIGPLSGFLGVNVVLWALALPPVTETVGRNGTAHALEELALVLLGLLFWAQVIDQPPLRVGRSHLWRAAYLLTASAQQRVLALVLGFAQAPFYADYVREVGASRALVDQQLGAGILLVPGVLTDTLVLTVCLFLWLNDDLRDRPLRRRASQPASRGTQPRPRAVQGG